MLMLFILGLLPLVLFALLDYYSGLKEGVFGAVLLAAITGGITVYLIDGVLFEVILILVAMIVMGGIAIKKDNEVYFKFQPVVTNIGLILFLGYFQFFDTPLVTKMLPKMTHLIPPENRHMIENPQFIATMERMSVYMMFWILVHTFLVGYVAKNSTNSKWVLAKAIGAPMVIVGSLITNVLIG